MDVADVSKNTKLIIDKIPCNVEEVDFVKPGKGRAIYRLKLRNLLDGSTIDRTYHSGDKVEEVDIIAEEHQYLYKEDDNYVFMNCTTFEHNFISAKQLGDKKYFIKEGAMVTLLMMGDRPLDVLLPNSIELEVVEIEVALKKETISAETKSAILETGYKIEVPTFLRKGDIIKVDTRTGKYVERVTTKK